MNDQKQQCAIEYFTYYKAKNLWTNETSTGLTKEHAEEKKLNPGWLVSGPDTGQRWNPATKEA